jgi:hypothetical protein
MQLNKPMILRLNNILSQTVIKFLISIFLVSLPQILFSQHTSLSGKVVDSQNMEPLAFVNILVNNDYQVIQTDIDGNFQINYSVRIDSIKLSYVGYETYVYKMPDKKNVVISLKKKEIQLNEVVIFPGENPAHRIINLMIANKDKNNPEKLGSFSYISYNKMIFTANMDSVKTDSVNTDSNMLETKAFFENQYLFLMESVTERKFMFPDKNNEKLVASKVSGFKDPLFALLVTQMQSFSFYSELIHIGDKNYITPVSKGSTDRYFFLLEDTLYSGTDSIYVISFKPHKSRNFDGLKGLLYINTNGYAIQDVIAEPANAEEGGLAIKIQQKYELIGNKQWFPVQLNSDFLFKNISINKIKLIGKGRSYLQDINLNPDLDKKDFSNIELEVKDANVAPEDTLWKAYRIDSLTAKDKRTYQVIDSLGKEAHFERTMRFAETLLSGKIPVKFADIDLDKIIHFNGYEGLRLGFGMHTNYKFSKRIIFGGYTAYGFHDKTFKYGGDAALKISQKNDISIGVRYFNDVKESGGISFFEQNPLLGDAQLRNYMINVMDKVEKREAFIAFNALRYLKGEVGLSQINKSVTNDYAYGINYENVSVLLKNYNFTELSANLCYSYKEKFIKTLRYKISQGTNYPIIWFNYIHGFNNFLDGEFAYNKYEFKIKKSFYIKSLGTPTFHLQAGYIDGDLPYCNLYNGIGSYRQFTIAAPNSFNTMRMNEFLSNRYAALFFTHSFGKLLLRVKKFAPEFAIATNFCIGDLNNKNKHFNVDIRTLSKGYIESGLLINNILNSALYGLGLGAYYRYGSYAFPEFKNNIAYKFTLTLNM